MICHTPLFRLQSLISRRIFLSWRKRSGHLGTSLVRLLFDLFVRGRTQIFIRRPEHPLHQHAPGKQKQTCHMHSLFAYAATCASSEWRRYLYPTYFAYFIFVWPVVNEDAHSPFSLNLLRVEGKHLEMKEWTNQTNRKYNQKSTLMDGF